MDQRTKTALQRQKVREGLGILRGVGELFGVDGDVIVNGNRDIPAYEEWIEKLDEYEKWIFDESPIA